MEELKFEAKEEETNYGVHSPTVWFQCQNHAAKGNVDWAQVRSCQVLGFFLWVCPDPENMIGAHCVELAEKIIHANNHLLYWRNAFVHGWSFQTNLTAFGIQLETDPRKLKTGRESHHRLDLRWVREMLCAQNRTLAVAMGPDIVLPTVNVSVFVPIGNGF